jgi:hypothetical protein
MRAAISVSRSGSDNGMVLGRCEQGKGDAKENADDRGSDESEE